MILFGEVTTVKPPLLATSREACNGSSYHSFGSSFSKPSDTLLQTKGQLDSSEAQ